MSKDYFIEKPFIMADHIDLWTDYITEPSLYYSDKVELPIAPGDSMATVTIAGQSLTFRQKGGGSGYTVLDPKIFRNGIRKETIQMVYDIWNLSGISRVELFTAARSKERGWTLSDILKYVLRDQEALDTLFKEYEAYKKEQEEKNKKPEPKEITVAEIEKALGYPVKIVKESHE